MVGCSRPCVWTVVVTGRVTHQCLQKLRQQSGWLTVFVNRLFSLARKYTRFYERLMRNQRASPRLDPSILPQVGGGWHADENILPNVPPAGCSMRSGRVVGRVCLTCSRSRAASEASSTTSRLAFSSSLTASSASDAWSLRCSAFFAARAASRASWTSAVVEKNPVIIRSLSSPRGGDTQEEIVNQIWNLNPL